jgi:hypothetical protein
MSVAFKDVGTFHESSVPWPAVHDAGDVAILFVETASGTVTTPTDCTVGPVIANGAGTTKLATFLIEATDNSMPNLALAGGADHLIGVIMTLEGTTLGDVLEALHTYAAAYATAAAVGGFAPGVYVDEPDCHVIHAIAWAIDDATDIASAWANANLTGFAERISGGTATGNGGGISIASGQLAAAGFTGLGTCTLTSTTFACLTLVFKSGAAAPAFEVADTVTIAGAPAPNGESVYVLDWAGAIAAGLITEVVIAGGAGGYTAMVEHNDADRYRAIYDDGDSRGCSALVTAT